MNTEDVTQTRNPAEELHFDAHEFDGLREVAEACAGTLLERTDRFVRSNPWLCATVALALGCALAGWLTRRSDESETNDSR